MYKFAIKFEACLLHTGTAFKVVLVFAREWPALIKKDTVCKRKFYDGINTLRTVFSSLDFASLCSRSQFSSCPRHVISVGN